jgi:hypothetical protein
LCLSNGSFNKLCIQQPLFMTGFSTQTLMKPPELLSLFMERCMSEQRIQMSQLQLVSLPELPITSMILLTDLSTLSVTTVAAAVVNNLVNHHYCRPISTLNSEVEGSRRTLVFTPLSGTSLPNQSYFPNGLWTQAYNYNGMTIQPLKVSSTIYRSTDNINSTHIASVNSTTSGGTGNSIFLFRCWINRKHNLLLAHICRK